MVGMTGSLEQLWDSHCELTDRHVNLIERVDRVSESLGLIKPGKPKAADKVPDPPAAPKPADKGTTRPPQPPPAPSHTSAYHHDGENQWHAPSPPAPTNQWGKNPWHDQSGWTEGMKADAQKALGADGQWHLNQDGTGYIKKWVTENADGAWHGCSSKDTW